MWKEKYLSSKIPLFLVLLYVLNLVILICAQVLLLYRFPAQPDADALARYDSVYEHSSVFNQDSRNHLTATLVYTYDGQPHLIVTKAHPIAYGRGKIIYAQALEIPETGKLTVTVKNGIHSSEILVQKVPDNFLSVSFQYAASGGIREYATVYMLLTALLEGLELVVWNLIKQNLM